MSIPIEEVALHAADEWFDHAKIRSDIRADVHSYYEGYLAAVAAERRRVWDAIKRTRDAASWHDDGAGLLDDLANELFPDGEPKPEGPQTLTPKEQMKTKYGYVAKKLSYDIFDLIHGQSVDAIAQKSGVDVSKLRLATDADAESLTLSDVAKIAIAMGRFPEVVFHPVSDTLGEDEIHTCGTCGRRMDIVRPGKWQCPKCEDT